MQGTAKGGRRQVRQKQRWEDNIREWTDLEFAKSKRAVENREKWRKLVAKSSVVPQRLSRLSLIHISYKKTYEVRAKVKKAIRSRENLLTIVKRRQLQWYGHVSRSSGLAKTILQGTVKGGRRQGRQKQRWEDNISEWTGLGFAKSQRAVENRDKWRKLVAKSSVVPQRPSC